MSRAVMTRAPVAAQARMRYGDAPSQFFDVWKPAVEPAVTPPLVVVIHGGFWRVKFDLTYISHLCAALCEAGMLVASLEYRRVGEAGGGWPGTFDDVLSGFHAARQSLAPASRAVVAGHSAGGHLALLLATRMEPVHSVVALAPVACLWAAEEENLGDGAVREFLGQSPPQGTLFTADPSVHPATVPRFLVHGTIDTNVPISQSRCFLEARAGDEPPPRLNDIAHADHFDIVDPESAAWPKVMEAFRNAVR